MKEVQYVQVSSEESGQRLDNFLVRVLKGVPKSHIYRIIRSGEVRVNKKRAKAQTRLEDGDSIRIPPVRTATEKITFVGDQLSEKLAQSILYEDKFFLIMNKPAGLAVHGGSGLSLGLIEAIRKMREDCPYLELVHRLDRDTSGCLVLAKKRSVLRALQRQFEAREVKKVYWAILLHPWQGKPHVEVDASLSKNSLKSGERFAKIDPEGKSSRTEFKLMENYDLACWVEAHPLTGRTHQIRAHSAHIGHPILGDEKYGGAKCEFLPEIEHSTLYLHARSIQFTLNENTYLFEAEPDRHFKKALEQLQSRSISSHE